MSNHGTVQIRGILIFLSTVRINNSGYSEKETSSNNRSD